jgi:FkbM family methyltransferase
MGFGIKRRLRPVKEYLQINYLLNDEEERKKLLRAWRTRGRRYVTVKVHHQWMKLDLIDWTMTDQLFVLRTWERYETALFRAVVQPGMCVADIGAHIGYYTLLAAQAVGSKGRVLAFEAAPSNFELLQYNLARNRCARIVTAENVAITDRARQLELYLSNHNTGDHRIFPSNAYDDQLFNEGKARTSVPIRGIALDEYLADHGIARVDVIKMDVQGAEWDALRGMRRTLEQPHIIMFMEYWPHALALNGADPKALLRWLEDLELQLLLIDRDAEQLRRVDGKEFAEYALTLDPNLQIDLLATRAADKLFDRLKHA